MSFLGVLGIVFIVLRLTDSIGWSWWLVTMPLWFVPAYLLGKGVVVSMLGFANGRQGRAEARMSARTRQDGWINDWDGGGS